MSCTGSERRTLSKEAIVGKLHRAECGTGLEAKAAASQREVRGEFSAKSVHYRRSGPARRDESLERE